MTYEPRPWVTRNGLDLRKYPVDGLNGLLTRVRSTWEQSRNLNNSEEDVVDMANEIVGKLLEANNMRGVRAIEVDKVWRNINICIARSKRHYSPPEEEPNTEPIVQDASEDETMEEKKEDDIPTEDIRVEVKALTIITSAYTDAEIGRVSRNVRDQIDAALKIYGYNVEDNYDDIVEYLNDILGDARVEDMKHMGEDILFGIYTELWYKLLEKETHLSINPKRRFDEVDDIPDDIGSPSKRSAGPYRTPYSHTIEVKGGSDPEESDTEPDAPPTPRAKRGPGHGVVYMVTDTNQYPQPTPTTPKTNTPPDPDVNPTGAVGVPGQQSSDNQMVHVSSDDHKVVVRNLFPEPQEDPPSSDENKEEEEHEPEAVDIDGVHCKSGCVYELMLREVLGGHVANRHPDYYKNRIEELKREHKEAKDTISKSEKKLGEITNTGGLEEQAKFICDTVNGVILKFCRDDLGRVITDKTIDWIDQNFDYLVRRLRAELSRVYNDAIHGDEEKRYFMNIASLNKGIFDLFRAIRSSRKRSSGSLMSLIRVLYAQNNFSAVNNGILADINAFQKQYVNKVASSLLDLLNKLFGVQVDMLDGNRYSDFDKDINNIMLLRMVTETKKQDIVGGVMLGNISSALKTIPKLANLVRTNVEKELVKVKTKYKADLQAHLDRSSAGGSSSVESILHSIDYLNRQISKVQQDFDSQYPSFLSVSTSLETLSDCKYGTFDGWVSHVEELERGSLRDIESRLKIELKSKVAERKDKWTAMERKWNTFLADNKSSYDTLKVQTDLKEEKLQIELKTERKMAETYKGYLKFFATVFRHQNTAFDTARRRIQSLRESTNALELAQMFLGSSAVAADTLQAWEDELTSAMQRMAYVETVRDHFDIEMSTEVKVDEHTPLSDIYANVLAADTQNTSLEELLGVSTSAEDASKTPEFMDTLKDGLSTAEVEVKTKRIEILERAQTRAVDVITTYNLLMDQINTQLELLRGSFRDLNTRGAIDAGFYLKYLSDILVQQGIPDLGTIPQNVANILASVQQMTKTHTLSTLMANRFGDMEADEKVITAVSELLQGAEVVTEVDVVRDTVTRYLEGDSKLLESKDAEHEANMADKLNTLKAQYDMSQRAVVRAEKSCEALLGRLRHVMFRSAGHDPADSEDGLSVSKEEEEKRDAMITEVSDTEDQQSSEEEEDSSSEEEEEQEMKQPSDIDPYEALEYLMKRAARENEDYKELSQQLFHVNNIASGVRDQHTMDIAFLRTVAKADPFDLGTINGQLKLEYKESRLQDRDDWNRRKADLKQVKDDIRALRKKIVDTYGGEEDHLKVVEERDAYRKTLMDMLTSLTTYARLVFDMEDGYNPVNIFIHHVKTMLNNMSTLDHARIADIRQGRADLKTVSLQRSEMKGYTAVQSGEHYIRKMISSVYTKPREQWTSEQNKYFEFLIALTFHFDAEIELPSHFIRKYNRDVCMLYDPVAFVRLDGPDDIDMVTETIIENTLRGVQELDLSYENAMDVATWVNSIYFTNEDPDTRWKDHIRDRVPISPLMKSMLMFMNKYKDGLDRVMTLLYDQWKSGNFIQATKVVSYARDNISAIEKVASQVTAVHKDVLNGLQDLQTRFVDSVSSNQRQLDIQLRGLNTRARELVGAASLACAPKLDWESIMKIEPVQRAWVTASHETKEYFEDAVQLSVGIGMAEEAYDMLVTSMTSYIETLFEDYQGAKLPDVKGEVIREMVAQLTAELEKTWDDVLVEYENDPNEDKEKAIITRWKDLFSTMYIHQLQGATIPEIKHNNVPPYQEDLIKNAIETYLQWNGKGWEPLRMFVQDTFSGNPEAAALYRQEMTRFQSLLGDEVELKLYKQRQQHMDAINKIVELVYAGVLVRGDGDYKTKAEAIRDAQLRNNELDYGALQRFTDELIDLLITHKKEGAAELKDALDDAGILSFLNKDGGKGKSNGGSSSKPDPNADMNALLESDIPFKRFKPDDPADIAAILGDYKSNDRVPTENDINGMDDNAFPEIFRRGDGEHKGEPSDPPKEWKHYLIRSDETKAWHFRKHPVLETFIQFMSLVAGGANARLAHFIDFSFVHQDQATFTLTTHQAFTNIVERGAKNPKRMLQYIGTVIHHLGDKMSDFQRAQLEAQKDQLEEDKKRYDTEKEQQRIMVAVQLFILLDPRNFEEHYWHILTHAGHYVIQNMWSFLQSIPIYSRDRNNIRLYDVIRSETIQNDLARLCSLRFLLNQANRSTEYPRDLSIELLEKEHTAVCHKLANQVRLRHRPTPEHMPGSEDLYRTLL